MNSEAIRLRKRREPDEPIKEIQTLVVGFPFSKADLQYHVGKAKQGVYQLAMAIDVENVLVKDKNAW